MPRIEKDNLSDLNHSLRNHIVCIESCLKEIEHNLGLMRRAVNEYLKTNEETKDGSPG